MNPEQLEIAAGTIKRVHVNQHVIRRNAKTGSDDAPLSVKLSARSVTCRRVAIDGPSEVVYSAENPLKCGARVWIETRAAITVDP